MSKTDFEKRGPVESPGSGFYIDGTEVIGSGNTLGILKPYLILTAFNSANDTCHTAIPVACRLTRFRTVCSADPGTTGVITIMKNGSATSHTLTTSAVTDDSSAISGGTTFAAGDSIGIKNTVAGNSVTIFVFPELMATA